MSKTFEPTRTIETLYARIIQFLENYGDDPPSRKSKRSLDMISDFLLVTNCELEFGHTSVPAVNTISFAETIRLREELEKAKAEINRMSHERFSMNSLMEMYRREVEELQRYRFIDESRAAGKDKK